MKARHYARQENNILIDSTDNAECSFCTRELHFVSSLTFFFKLIFYD